METVVEKINALTHEPGYIYTLVLILLRDLFLSAEDIAEINPREHLNIQELTFLLGLLVKQNVQFVMPSEAESERRFELTYSLFDELHRKYQEPVAEQLTKLVKSGRRRGETGKENYRRVFGQGLTMAEPIFYAASGGYDFQYRELAAKKYNKDAQWLQAHVGINISEMAKIARKLKCLHEERFNNLVSDAPTEFSAVCTSGLSVFCFTNDDFPDFPPDILEGFLQAFSLTPGTVNASLKLPGQFNELQARPIITLGDGRWFLPVAFNLSEAIYESPFFWMIRDPAYRDTAFRHRGEFAEQMAAELLAGTFGPSNVYRDVEVRERKGRALTDIDVLALIGNKAVIAQVKSKRLTELARCGDEKKLEEDFELAVQEAYDQGVLCRAALTNGDNKLLLNGSELRLSEPIDDAYILCLTVDSYPAVIHQVDVYLRKQPNDPFPIAISILDLDVLTFYLPDPFEFAYYLRQRVSLTARFKADSEITLLGYHLKHKLFEGEGDLVMLDGSYAQLVDANFQVLRGSVPHTGAANKLHSKWKNADFQSLVDQIKSTAGPKFTDAIFFLYDLAGKGADNLIAALHLTKRKTLADQRPHDARLPIPEFRSGMTILCEPVSPIILKNKLLGLSRVAKYKSKANLWLGFGCLATSDRLVDAVVFANYEWRYDPGLEALAAQLKGRLMTAEGRKIGRNEPCPCKSGKKFKWCCGR